MTLSEMTGKICLKYGQKLQIPNIKLIQLKIAKYFVLLIFLPFRLQLVYFDIPHEIVQKIYFLGNIIASGDLQIYLERDQYQNSYKQERRV